MATQSRETTSQQVERLLNQQGRKKKWLAEQMGVEYQTIYLKLRDNTWSVAEIMLLDHLLGLDRNG